MTRQEKPAGKFRRPTRLDKPKVQPFVRSINFVADNRVTNRGEMHTDLVRPAGFRQRADQCELISMEFR